METKINYSQVPYEYKMCLNRECQQSGTCLRQLVEQAVPAEVRSIIIVSPKHMATLEGACPYYRSVTKVHYAKGFLRLLENLPYKQMQIVISHLVNYFGRRNYYRVRKGERLLSPHEQKQVSNILENCGVSRPHEFDEYIEDYDW